MQESSAYERLFYRVGLEIGEALRNLRNESVLGFVFKQTELNQLYTD